jgi:GT2 family glycosyltransferase
MGRRPVELARAITSICTQRDVDVDVAVVGNGWTPHDLPARAHGVALATNVGIAAGRNVGVPHVRGEFLLFLDDDAALGSPDFLRRAVDLMTDQPEVGVVQPRPVDPVSGRTPRSFVPRLRVGDPARDSDLVALWEGAVVTRREVFEAAGGWPEPYFYQHEGIEFAWRVIDAGYRVRYVGTLLALHDAKQPGRDPDYYRMQARNRVWLARRNLPLPLAVGYVMTWVALTVLRARSRLALRESARGWVQGLRTPCGDRRPIRWRTVWRMTKAGRPPLV